MVDKTGLKGKIALVTGSSQGIGKSICLKLASLGANIIVNDIIDESSASASLNEIKKLGVEVDFIQADVSQGSQVREMVDKIIDNSGRIDILVNNAGIARDGLIIRMKEGDWDKVLAVNLKGVFNCTQAVARYMMKNRSGSIINIASIVGVIGNVGQVNYAASKAGVIALTKTVARELASRGVRANAIAPGFIKTEMTEKLSSEVKQKLFDEIPQGRLGEPEDVADAVAFLASDESQYITGQVLHVNGGMLM